jgi:hypothetical protein
MLVISRNKETLDARAVSIWAPRASWNGDTISKKRKAMKKNMPNNNHM